MSERSQTLDLLLEHLNILRRRRAEQFPNWKNGWQGFSIRNPLLDRKLADLNYEIEWRENLILSLEPASNTESQSDEPQRGGEHQGNKPEGMSDRKWAWHRLYGLAKSIKDRNQNPNPTCEQIAERIIASGELDSSLWRKLGFKGHIPSKNTIVGRLQRQHIVERGKSKNR
jgi:hypothetical protein